MCLRSNLQVVTHHLEQGSDVFHKVNNHQDSSITDLGIAYVKFIEGDIVNRDQSIAQFPY